MSASNRFGVSVPAFELDLAQVMNLDNLFRDASAAEIRVSGKSGVADRLNTVLPSVVRSGVKTMREREG